MEAGSSPIVSPRFPTRQTTRQPPLGRQTQHTAWHPRTVGNGTPGLLQLRAPGSERFDAEMAGRPAKQGNLPDAPSKPSRASFRQESVRITMGQTCRHRSF